MTTDDVALVSLVTLHDRLLRAERETKVYRAARNEMIRQLRDQGVSVAEIADALNLTRKAVYLVLESER